jgi:DNA-binding beta-propeller fold protein YncE
MNGHRARTRALVLAAALGGFAVWLAGLASAGPTASAFLPAAVPATAGANKLYGFGEPTAIALLANGDVLVADVGQPQVLRFAPDGGLRRAYVDSALRYPTGLAAADDNRVWVADLWQRSIFQIDLESAVFAALPSERSGYEAPAALAYHDGRLYVADLQRQQVLVIDAGDGRLIQAIGRGAGREPGQFAYPNGIWPAANGEVFVSDTSNQRIQVFDTTGRLQRVLQPAGLDNPRGIAQDARGRLHVVDSVANEVVVLDPAAGDVLARYGADDDLASPMGLAVRGRRVYVADRGNARVLFWELEP